ncbi:DrmB family protein [Paenibacillus terreus]|uniref:DrmB family protein n=1 Tax=Paenibacillus terreus TaxID=1387834 RepID=A0ABV5B5M6_9BACL
MSTHLVGQVRPSQLLWTYGPGALIDLPNLSVITMGLDRWDINRCPPVEEARLLAAVSRLLGPQVERLRTPPFLIDEGVNPMSAEGKIGVPVRPFPRWLRCVKCGLLGEFDSGLFNIKPNPYRPEQTHFVHANCEKGTKSDAVPARFLLACRNGHLDDFPWHWFVHSGPSECRGTLRFFERGASLQTENLWVKCDSCGVSRSLVHAFGKEAQENLPACRGRHPHLDSYDHSCSEAPRAVLLGATNSWFPVTLSVLAIPLEKNHLSQLVLDGWEYFSDVESPDEVRVIVKTLSKSGGLPGIEQYEPLDIWQAIQEKNNGNSQTDIISEVDIKIPEWDVLTMASPPSDFPQFLSRKTETPTAYKDKIDSVLLLERLREVNALIGYTRVEAPEESLNEEERPPMANLSRGRPTWVPAGEVYGEGIFIKFQEEEVENWAKRIAVHGRDQKLRKGHQGWRNTRGLNPEEGYPSIRYAMLHTFAHLLIRELALECGYNAASIRERIYASDDPNSRMAGVLLYTAAADSDGTLGGLVELGKPENLERLITQALTRATICSSDPLCSEHNPGDDRSLHSASCHACSLVPETSCERGNRYLDRALLVRTFECQDAAFFEGGRNSYG